MNQNEIYRVYQTCLKDVGPLIGLQNTIYNVELIVKIKSHKLETVMIHAYPPTIKSDAVILLNLYKQIKSDIILKSRMMLI